MSFTFDQIVDALSVRFKNIPLTGTEDEFIKWCTDHQILARICFETIYRTEDNKIQEEEAIRMLRAVYQKLKL